ncbi:Uncharacterised protein [Vibrio cholerae]|uniref:Uncharacterized protein n=1 Tax=Vibrio cholerae TaxID=666 RepID=A0A655UQN2_VIBCL|nr:Uncharacterised protein [Vibrio cholerae]
MLVQSLASLLRWFRPAYLDALESPRRPHPESHDPAVCRACYDAAQLGLVLVNRLLILLLPLVQRHHHRFQPTAALHAPSPRVAKHNPHHVQNALKNRCVGRSYVHDHECGLVRRTHTQVIHLWCQC